MSLDPNTERLSTDAPIPRHTEVVDPAVKKADDIPKPLTPKEKIRAITPESGEDNKGHSVCSPRPGFQFYHTGGYLPLTYRANQAPAKQSLGLCHGRTSLRNVAVA